MAPCKFTAQLDSVRTTKDGGGKLTLEFGQDSLDAIHQLQKLTGQNLAIVIVPYVEPENDKYRCKALG